MTEHLASGVVRPAGFSVCADPPSLLHLSGELDAAGGPALALALEGAVTQGGPIGLDLAELTFMDSTGIHALLRALRLLGERGRIVVYEPSRTIRRLIEICGLGDVVDIDEDAAQSHQRP